MDTQITKFTTAKLAKEKGFESGQYNRLLYSLSSQNVFPAVGAGYDMDIAIEAPSQSLLQQWLREKHHIHITITPHRVRLRRRNMGKTSL